MPKNTHIQFSLDADYREKLQELSQDGESIGLCAKRLLLDFLEGGNTTSTVVNTDIEERLADLEQKLKNLESSKENPQPDQQSSDSFQKILDAIQELKTSKPEETTQSDSLVEIKLQELENRLRNLETKLTEKAIALFKPLLNKHAEDVDQALEIIQEQIKELERSLLSSDLTAGDDSVQNRYPVQEDDQEVEPGPIAKDEVDQEDVQGLNKLSDAQVARHLKTSKTTAANLRKGITTCTSIWRKKMDKAGITLKDGFWFYQD